MYVKYQQIHIVSSGLPKLLSICSPTVMAMVLLVSNNDIYFVLITVSKTRNCVFIQLSEVRISQSVSRYHQLLVKLLRMMQVRYRKHALHS